jgi:hypothetical protein
MDKVQKTDPSNTATSSKHLELNQVRSCTVRFFSELPRTCRNSYRGFNALIEILQADRNAYGTKTITCSTCCNRRKLFLMCLG